MVRNCTVFRYLYYELSVAVCLDNYTVNGLQQSV